MSIEKSKEEIVSLVKELVKQPQETEWLEFKQNNKDPKAIGEYISSLSNSAALNGKINAYIIWGVDNETQEIVGTTFSPSTTKIGNEELESWLLKLLTPKIDFNFSKISIDMKTVVLLEISPAHKRPTGFNGLEYIRVGSYQKKLKDFAEKERKLWRIFDKIPFEKCIAADNLESNQVLEYLEYTSYFELLKLPLPDNKTLILESLTNHDLINKKENGKYSISNLGAILFAKELKSFHHLKRKAIRVIQYNGDTKLNTIKELTGNKGYAVGFENLIISINNLLPSNEVIKKALRHEEKMYPEVSVREIVANAIIHQDFFQTGNSVMIEIFANRFEVTNPGKSLVHIDRFLDYPPKSRNEALAYFMRAIGICEERGSGIDKIVLESEVHQLPAPLFETTSDCTRVILFSYKHLKDMDKSEKIRACYQHSVLKYLKKDYMTNTSLRGRFGISDNNKSMVSKIISETIQEKKICIHDKTVGTRARKYVPWWTSNS